MEINLGSMIVLVVLITAIASVMRARYGIRRDAMGNELPIHDKSGEAERMREEVKALRERVQVLERIATDRNHLLEQEIDRLRDQ